jgi:hypothetical protein
MRFMVIVPGNEQSEAGIMPDTSLFEEMGRFNEELVNAGVLLAAEGLAPTSKGARIEFANGTTRVIDGPFTETKELIAGFWLVEVKSKEEAIEWFRRAPFGGGVSLEIRQVAEADDLGPEFTPELQEREARLREQIANNQ